jgi:pimeloyl-ACP methyl ester carboxylesterase
MMLPIVFVHGSGAAGAEAWLAFADADLGREKVFLTRPGSLAQNAALAGLDTDAQAVIEAAGDGAHVVAHSYGAISAIRAAELSPATIASLVLFEPSAFSLVRGHPAVESRITSIQDETRGSDRWRAQTPPWDAGLNPDVFAGVATLAVWGGADPAYDAVIARMVELGAERAELPEYGHGLAAAPEAVDLVNEFIERVEARASG